VGILVTIRQYQPGDEQAQVALYNAAAGPMPKFKAATPQEVERRVRARDFDPTTRLYAEANGHVVGYCMIQPNGRVGYPWCAAGHEAQAPALLDAALAALRKRGVRQAFTAYRGDWPAINKFFLERGFRPTREMVNFAMDFLDMPTPPGRPCNTIGPLRPNDVPEVLSLGAGVLRITSANALTEYLFANPYFPSNALFALRNRPDGPPLAVGIFITERSYANPRAVDSNMPCFRLGAFGTEGMSTKRIVGLFSFLARPERSLPAYGMDLLGYAAQRLSDNDDIASFAAQVPSDAPALLAFYQQHFQRQGSFPVLERQL
jgi:hypothetical protein